jgi:hypothetical protein
MLFETLHIANKQVVYSIIACFRYVMGVVCILLACSFAYPLYSVHIGS